MNAFDRLAAMPPAISTKAELLQRLAQRAAPSPVCAYVPKGEITTHINTAMARSNEARIARLRRSLAQSSETFSRDQARARLQGHSKVAFERNR